MNPKSTATHMEAALKAGGSDAETVSRPPCGFTLIEVMVVTAIIALLVSILLPSLVAAKNQAKAVACLSNMRQIGIGLTGYVLNNRDRYPKHSSPSTMVPRRRWPDYMHRYMRNTGVYKCPTLSGEQETIFKQPFAHTVDQITGLPMASTQYHGGYGYNFQYLGNARTRTGGSAPLEWATPYHANAQGIRTPALTLAVADTQGSRKGDATRQPGRGGSAVYIVDPPLGSRDLGSRGSRANSDPASGNMWYEGGTTVQEEFLFRSAPDDRHAKRVSVLFCDGHAEPMRSADLDGRRDGGDGDNRYFNGLFNASKQ